MMIMTETLVIDGIEFRAPGLSLYVMIHARIRVTTLAEVLKIQQRKVAIVIPSSRGDLGGSTAPTRAMLLPLHQTAHFACSLDCDTISARILAAYRQLCREARAYEARRVRESLQKGLQKCEESGSK